MGADNAQNILGYNSADNQFDSSNVISDEDGSIIERQEFLQTQTAGARRQARRTYDFDVDGGAQGALTMFTVTGTVLVEIFGVCQASMDSGGAATIELGIAGNTAALIAQTTATDLDQYESWQDATPETNPGAVNPTGRTFVITNGADIIMTIGTADLAAGVIDFYCFWTPLSANGNVVAA